jgi:hypothetical protein
MSAGQVRPFVEDDIAQAGELHRRVFGVRGARKALAAAYERYFRQVFLNNPWRQEGVGPLVYEENGGRIAGFLGVMGLPMRLQGRRVNAAVSSQFIVDPESRARLAGVRLLRAFLSGPQDLSFADEANEASRRIWEFLGGTTALLYSMHWTRALRPLQFARLRASGSRVLGPLGFLSAPLCAGVDAVAARLRRSRLPGCGPRLAEEDPGLETLLACSEAARAGCSLQPRYDERTLRWLLERAAGAAGRAGFYKVVLRNGSGGLAGWYLYGLDERGVGEVLQIGSTNHSTREVLEHLLDHAWGRGAVAVRGRLQPPFLRELWSGHGLRHHRRYWMLVHSRRPELLQAVERGDAFLTRLEGEWCLRFACAGAEGEPRF